LDVGSEEKVMLQSHDEQNIILVTYKDLKKALNKVSWKSYFDGHMMALESNFKIYFFSVSAIYIFNKQKTNNIVSSFDYLLFKSSES